MPILRISRHPEALIVLLIVSIIIIIPSWKFVRYYHFSESIVNDHEWIVPLFLIALFGIYGLIIGKIVDFFVVKRSDKKNAGDPGS